MEKQQLTELLQKEVVSFVYEKKGGGMREAIGTLIPSKMPPPKPIDPTAEPKPQKETAYVTYWDLEAKGFRMVNPETVRCLNVVTLQYTNDTIQENKS